MQRRHPAVSPNPQSTYCRVAAHDPRRGWRQPRAAPAQSAPTIPISRRVTAPGRGSKRSIESNTPQTRSLRLFLKTPWCHLKFKEGTIDHKKGINIKGKKTVKQRTLTADKTKGPKVGTCRVPRLPLQTYTAGEYERARVEPPRAAEVDEVKVGDVKRVGSTALSIAEAGEVEPVVLLASRTAAVSEFAVARKFKYIVAVRPTRASRLGEVERIASLSDSHHRPTRCHGRTLARLPRRRGRVREVGEVEAGEVKRVASTPHTPQRLGTWSLSQPPHRRG